MGKRDSKRGDKHFNNKMSAIEKYEVVCTGLNDIGQGTFNIGKNSYSVSNLLPSEKCIVEENDYQGVKKFKVVKILAPSKKRCEVKCKAYNKCGSCHLLHLKYEDQISFKKDYVNKCFKNEKLNIHVDEICRANVYEGYRNKMAVAYRFQNKELVYGFYEEDTHRIINNDYCFCHTKEQNEIVNKIARIMKDLKIAPYDEDKRTGVIRFVLVRFGRFSKEYLVTIVTNGSVFPGRSEFVKRLRNECPYITTIVQNINTRKTSIILGEDEQVLYGKGYITDEICGISFNISSSTFFQVNPYQVEVLYNKVKEYLNPDGNEVLIDAYCGVGTIGMTLASSVKEVIGVENNKKSIINAKNNAINNKIKNIRFYNEDATEFLVGCAKDRIRVDALIMDPPRTGSTEAFLNAVNILKPEKVIYVSCEASTLARDLKILLKEYSVKKVGIVDMFVGTYHVECISSLVLRNISS